ncbi:MAG: hypothetical protein QXD89_01115 [Candidatus Aenigmatarchaeota archaeon]
MLYEKLCNFFEKIPIYVPKNLEERYYSEILFCNLNVKPKGVFSLAVYLPLFLLIFLTFILTVFNWFSLSLFLSLSLLSFVIFYFLLNYTKFLSIKLRAKGSSEMALCIVYMAISLKIHRNLESAILFAAENLSGPIGKDLRKILWDIESNKIYSAEEGLDILINKWKVESEEFVSAISLLKSSLISPNPDKEINDAVRIMLTGTKDRMKRYGLRMRSPIKLLNMFGILLPLLVLIFFPVMTIFLPEISKPELLVIIYDVVLPFSIFFLTQKFYYTKPYSYHQVELAKTENYKKIEKSIFILSLGIYIPSTIFIFSNLFDQNVTYFGGFLYSYLFVLLNFLVFISFFLIPSFFYRKRNEELLKIEEELPTVIFELGIVSSIGKPIEKSIDDLIPKISLLKTRKVFEKILSNIKYYGLSIKESIFDEKLGIIKEYPSRMLSLSLKLIIDISQKSSYFLTEALKHVANFLKDADEVNKSTEEILSETISDLQIQAWVFAPLTTGIIIGLMSLLIYVLSFFGPHFKEISSIWSNSSSQIPSSLSFLLSFTNILPIQYFQVVVGIYLVSVVYIIASFLGELSYGDDEVRKKFEIGKFMLIALVIYSIISWGIYSLTSIIRMESLL